MRKLFLAVLPLFINGCLLISVSDPDAEKAVDIYESLHIPLPEKPLKLADALNMTPPEKHLKVRLTFGELAYADLEKDPAPSLIGWKEKKRIELNVLLGFLPSDKIAYDTAGVLNAAMPEEISHVTAAEKAALILDRGSSDPLELLEKVRLAHVDAVRAMNNKQISSSGNRMMLDLAYYSACVRLADIIGVPPEKLDRLTEYEKRFDAAQSRWKKSHTPLIINKK